MAHSVGDKRTYERTRLRGSIEFTWVDPDGNACSALGNCINISPTGLCVELPCEIPVGAQLEVRTKTVDLPGPLTVRNCRRCGPWFRIGLQFANLLIDSERFGANKAGMSLRDRWRGAV